MANMARVIVLLVRDDEDMLAADRLIQSLRVFGGDWRDTPIWIYSSTPNPRRARSDSGIGITWHFVPIPQKLIEVPFGAKVWTAADAESRLSISTQTMLFTDPRCLILREPSLYGLTDNELAAVRPVHVQNVGCPANEPLDGYWNGIAHAVGLADIPGGMKTFVDEVTIHPYFNTHLVSINPRQGLCREWLEAFIRLIDDRGFQTESCRNLSHPIFLFQAILSALLIKRTNPSTLRILPAGYNYPLHLHSRINATNQAKSSSDLVTAVYEDLSLEQITQLGLDLEEPFQIWLQDLIDFPDSAI